MAEIAKWPAEVQADAHGLWLAIQEATNSYIVSADRSLDERTLPLVLRLMLDEFERIVQRAKAES